MLYLIANQQSISSQWSITRLIFFLLSLTSYVYPSSRSLGCHSDCSPYPIPGASSVQKSIMQSNGLIRTYLIHLPRNYDQNNPTSLIFSFHGRGKTASHQEQLTGFSRPEWNSDAIVVYPQGFNNSWQGDPDSVNIDDIAFVREMISSLSDTYCLDTRRIYATGKSNGAGFVSTIACNAYLSKQIAAFAGVSGAYYIPGANETHCVAGFPQKVHLPCSAGRKNIPIMEFHGLSDPVIPYNGGPRRGACLPSIPHWLNEWAHREGFSSHDIHKTSLYDGNVTKYEFVTGSESAKLITHYSIKNLGHDWPSIKANLDNVNGTYLDATPIILKFFSNHKLEKSGGRIRRFGI